MPKKSIERAREDEREGKAPSTQAGEFVREEIDLIREGAHGARSTKQAIAIGLSKARRAGVKLPPPGPRLAASFVREKFCHLRLPIAVLGECREALADCPSSAPRPRPGGDLEGTC